MHRILDEYRHLCSSFADAVRWACTLEAIAPKLGNVHPSATFENLSVNHFIMAAEELAVCCDMHSTVGKIVLSAVQGTVHKCSTNVNLGIALLMAPVAVAHKRGIAVQEALKQMTSDDAALVYDAIRLAQPGGLGNSETMDVRDAPPSSLLDAMKVAADWDLIAKQYSTGYKDLRTFVIPCLEECIQQCGDVLMGIRSAQIKFLAYYGDSLVARKCGTEVNEILKHRATELLGIADGQAGIKAVREFDQWLREDSNRRNPGTTADMLAGGLLVLLLDRNLV